MDTNSKELPLDLFTAVLSAVKIGHWVAKKHSAHKVLDELYDDLYEDFDKFVESYLGLFENSYKTEGFKISSDDEIPPKEIVSILNMFLVTLKPYAEKNSELMSIYDDIKNDINKAVYLLNMCD